MKPITITTCDICENQVPSCFIKTTEDGSEICHPCYSGARKDRGQVDDFFEGQTPGEVERLRGTVHKHHKFTEPLPDPSTTHKSVWADEFAQACDRKAKWYGFADVFEFFGECLKD